MTYISTVNSHPLICQHRCSPLWTDGTSAGLEGSGDQLREKFWLCPVIHLDGTVGDLGSYPGPDKNCFLEINNVVLTINIQQIKLDKLQKSTLHHVSCKKVC